MNIWLVCHVEALRTPSLSGETRSEKTSYNDWARLALTTKPCEHLNHASKTVADPLLP
jgi:hypothetical protein